MITLKSVGTESIPAIRDITYRVWPLAYKDILSAEQLTYMLKLFYSPKALQRQIEELHHTFILAEENETPLGFASYGPHREERNIYHLHKLYVLPENQGKQIGKLILDHILDKIRAAGCTQLQLNVNRYNKALHFYKKLGFQILKEEDNDIGEGYFMNDYVMVVDC